MECPNDQIRKAAHLARLLWLAHEGLDSLDAEDLKALHFAAGQLDDLLTDIADQPGQAVGVMIPGGRV